MIQASSLHCFSFQWPVLKSPKTLLLQTSCFRPQVCLLCSGATEKPNGVKEGNLKREAMVLWKGARISQGCNMPTHTCCIVSSNDGNAVCISCPKMKCQNISNLEWYLFVTLTFETAGVPGASLHVYLMPACRCTWCQPACVPDASLQVYLVPACRCSWCQPAGVPGASLQVYLVPACRCTWCQPAGVPDASLQVYLVPACRCSWCQPAGVPGASLQVYLVPACRCSWCQPAGVPGASLQVFLVPACRCTWCQPAGVPGASLYSGLFRLHDVTG